MILIVGASGILGTITTKLLNKESLPLKALTRDPEKLRSKLPPGVTIVKGDLTDRTSLDTALSDVETVVASAHSLLGKGKNSSARVDELGMKSLIDLAKGKGIRHFVYISIYMATPESASAFIRTKYTIEQYLKASGIPYTIIRPAAFMEVHAYQLFGEGILKNGKAMVFGKGDKPCNYVAASDVAALATLVVKSGPANETINVGGPDNPTKLELGKIYERVTGRSVKLTHIPVTLLKIISKLSKPFHDGVSNVTGMSAAIDRLDMSMNMTETLKRFPIPQTTLETFIHQKMKEASS
jgi:uncharacterized protein YbjT (DUF2867 family)